MAQSKVVKGVVHATANWELTSEVAEQLEKNLRAIATPARAIQEKKYLKSDRDHLGVTVPEVRREVRALLRDTTWPKPRANFLELSRQLWPKISMN